MQVRIRLHSEVWVCDDDEQLDPDDDQEVWYLIAECTRNLPRVPSVGDHWQVLGMLFIEPVSVVAVQWAEDMESCTVLLTGHTQRVKMDPCDYWAVGWDIWDVELVET